MYLPRCKPKLVVVLSSVSISIARMWHRGPVHDLIPQADQVQLGAHEGDVLGRHNHLLLPRLLDVLLHLLVLLDDPLYGDWDGEPCDPGHFCQSRCFST